MDFSGVFKNFENKANKETQIGEGTAESVLINYLFIKSDYLHKHDAEFLESVNALNIKDHIVRITELVDEVNYKLLIEEEDRNIWNFNLTNIYDEDDEEEFE